MEQNDMIRMANQIADFFKAYPADEAKKEVAEHINKFWAPAMRQRLFEEFQDHPGAFNNLIAKSLLRINCDKYNPVKAVFRERHGTGG